MTQTHDKHLYINIQNIIDITNQNMHEIYNPLIDMIKPPLWSTSKKWETMFTMRETIDSIRAQNAH